MQIARRLFIGLKTQF